MSAVFRPSIGDFNDTPYAKLMGADGIISGFLLDAEREFATSVEHRDRAYVSTTGAEVLCTRFFRSGKREFAFAVTTKAGDDGGREVLLALRGTYDRSGKELTVNQIYMPSLDNTNTMRPPSQQDITPDNIRKALFFANKITEEALQDAPLDRRAVGTALRQVRDENKSLSDIPTSTSFAGAVTDASYQPISADR